MSDKVSVSRQLATQLLGANQAYTKTYLQDRKNRMVKNVSSQKFYQIGLGIITKAYSRKINWAAAAAQIVSPA